MQLNLKKIGTTLMGSVLTGATLLGGALAADVSDFNKMGPSDTVVVVGATAATADVVGAINIGAALAQNGVTATSTVGAATTTVEGGVNLATGSQALYLTSGLNQAKTTLSNVDLPTTLAATTFTDNAGTSYKYNQYITLGGTSTSTGSSSNKLKYGKEGSLTTPTDYLLLANGGAGTGNYAYYAQASFTDPINLDSTDVRGKVIRLFGNDYTITSTSSSNATTPQLVLFGAGTTTTLSEGDSSTVTVSGSDYAVKLLSVSDANTANIQVGSDVQSVTKGTSRTVGGINIFLNDVFYNPKQGTVSSAKIGVGSNKLTLKDGDAARTGNSDTIVSGTLVAITTSSSKLSTLKVYVAAPDLNGATVTEGSSFTDPVFKSFKLSFSGYTPSASETDAARDTITEQTSGNNRVTVGVTDYFGNAKTLEFAKNSNTGTPTATDSLLLADGNGQAYHIIEGESASLNDYIVTDAGSNTLAGDFSHLFKVTSIPTTFAAGASVTLQDVMTGTSTSFNLVTPTFKNGTAVIDGQTYNINVSGTTVSLTWGSSSGAGDPGAETTVYPGLRLKNSEWMYLTKSNQAITVSNSSLAKIKLPTGWLVANYTSGVTPTLAIATSTSSSALATTFTTLITGATGSGVLPATSNATKIGQQYYNLTAASVANTNTSATMTLNISLGDGTGVGLTQPAILVREPLSGSGAPNSNTYDTVTLKTSVDTNGVKVLSPLFTDTSATSTNTGSGSSSSITKYMNVWGSIASYDSTSQGKVTVAVPASQLTANLYLLTAAATAPASGTTTSGKVNLPSLGSGISKLDTEVGADKTAKNLVLVGGPAINTLVAELGTAGKTPTLTEWRTTLQGKGIIQAVGDAFATGKTAIVVAGYEKEQTGAAALKLATDETMTGAAKQVIGGVWSAFTYPIVSTPAGNTTGNATK